MPHYLPMRLEGLLQSWGDSSRHGNRSTKDFPTKSGAIGILAAAMGYPRTHSLDEFVSLKMFVRVDRLGRIMSDFHTAGSGTGVLKADGKVGKQAALSMREYVVDASFLVLLEGEKEALDNYHIALQKPHFSLCLGRKSCIPSRPIWLKEGPMFFASLAAAYEAYDCPNGQLVTFSEVPLIEADIILYDQITDKSFEDRKFVPRGVKQGSLNKVAVSSHEIVDNNISYFYHLEGDNNVL